MQKFLLLHDTLHREKRLHVQEVQPPSIKMRTEITFKLYSMIEGGWNSISSLFNKKNESHPAAL